jgi:hypothetical protein
MYLLKKHGTLMNLSKVLKILNYNRKGDVAKIAGDG